MPDGAPLVLAAADLRDALDAVAEVWTSTGRPRPELVYGSTGQLAVQIEHGAPADLFLAADESFVDRLQEAGFVEPGDRRPYAVGYLAVVTAPGVPLPATLAELAAPIYATLSLANPEHAPYGRAARDALRGAGVWEAVGGRVVLGENVLQALQFVRTGNADAGVVALGLVLGGAAPPPAHLRVEESLHAPLVQAAAVIRGARRAGEARAFLDLLTGPEGRVVLARYGFDAPPEVAARTGWR